MPPALLSARARSPALKSRGHSRSALGRSGSWQPADECASRRQRPSRRQQSAPIPLWPGRRRVSAAPTPTTVPSSAARGRRHLAAAARARPSSATRAREAERTSLLGLLSPPPSRLHRRRHSFTHSEALQKFAPGPGPLVPCPPGQESSWPLQPLSGLPRTDCRLAPRCQQLPGSGALLLGAAGEGALRTLPKTPAPEPQALALGSW